jgi:hypothetical protein
MGKARPRSRSAEREGDDNPSEGDRWASGKRKVKRAKKRPQPREERDQNAKIAVGVICTLKTDEGEIRGWSTSRMYATFKTIARAVQDKLKEEAIRSYGTDKVQRRVEFGSRRDAGTL